MIDNCASLLPNVVHSYLPISFLKVALFAMYLSVWLGLTFERLALLQILKELYRKKSTLNHSSRGVNMVRFVQVVFFMVKRRP